MRQRLGIADALVKDPDILILDEPTTAIDPIGVVEILELLRGLVPSGASRSCSSSHLLDQVQSVCDRVGIFAGGRLIGQGTVDELAARSSATAGPLEVGLDADGRSGRRAEPPRGRARRRRRRLGERPDPARRPAGTLRRWPATPSRRAAGDPRPAVAEHGLRLDRVRPGARRLDEIYRRGRRAARSATTPWRAGAVEPARTSHDRRRSSARRRPRPRRDSERPPACRLAGRRRARSSADHLLSARFLVLLVRARAGRRGHALLRRRARSARPPQAASGASRSSCKLFTLGARTRMPAVLRAASASSRPLLGIAFGFDAINGERAEGTLPRLLAQPIYRDDVINGKFVAGLGGHRRSSSSRSPRSSPAIGIIRLGIVPDGRRTSCGSASGSASVVYVGFWLAFAPLCSVAFRRAATSRSWPRSGCGSWLTLFARAARLARGRRHRPDAGRRRRPSS